MSTFYLGNPNPRIVSPEDLLPEMYEDRYFLPGVIHGGEDYLIRAYLNDSHAESGVYSDEEFTDHAQFEVDYITKDLIMEAKEIDPDLGDEFYQHLFGAECFGCANDGKSDFSALIDAWPKAMYLSHSELVDWAAAPYTYEDAKKIYNVVYEEVLSYSFPVHAANPALALEEFEKQADDCQPDFSGGDLVDARITKVLDERFYDVKKINDSFADLERKAEKPEVVVINPEKITIPLGDGFSLIAERNPDPDYKEIFVYLRRDDDGLVYQDLAIVGEDYSLKTDSESGNTATAPISGRYSVKVYSDPDSEEYQHDFRFGRYEEVD